jgi:hypothetical protein
VSGPVRMSSSAGLRLPALLGVDEVADLCRMPVEWVYSHRRLLPCVYVPNEDGPDLRSMRVRLADLETWVRAARAERRQTR